MKTVNLDFKQKLEKVGSDRGYYIYHEVPEKTNVETGYSGRLET